MDFLTYMSKQVADSPKESVHQLVHTAGGIDYVYIIYVDILKGFCEQGPLASKRVNEMVEPVTNLTQQLLNQGIPTENMVFLNDHHPSNAVEFSSFPPHCQEGSTEAEVVDMLKPIQQTEGVQTFQKNATNGMFGVNKDGMRFFEWLEKIFAKGKSTFVVVGDCTDLCIYQNAMGIRLFANEQNAEVDVLVPHSHVRTYDTPIEQAEQAGIYAHDADVMDISFLYHMKTNGIRVVSTIE